MKNAKLEIYYKKLYPFELIYKWYNYDGMESKDYFYRREFSFQYSEEAVKRYICFPNATEFKKKVCDEVPQKLDIGAVFNTLPKNNLLVKALIPKEKEFVVDIDMTDYDSFRFCCKDTNVCNECFNYMKIAVKVLENIFKVDFEFNNMLWVFSGRRGIHCWVSDSDARKLEEKMRVDIISYLTIKDKNKQINLVNGKMHPTFQRIYDKILLPSFEQKILIGQSLMQNEKALQLILSYLPNNVAKDLLEEFNTLSDPIERWGRIKHEANQSATKWNHPLYNLIFDFIYPKIDVEVSRKLSHLLKSPFAVHPSTEKICIPIDPEQIDSFDLNDVPSLDSLLNDINEWKPTQPNQSIPDYKKTKLKQYYSIFKNKFLGPLIKDETIQRSTEGNLDF